MSQPIDDSDDLDPTAVPSYYTGEPDEPLDQVASVSGESAGGAEADEDEWTPEQGFTDGTGQVRIWVDDDYHLSNVQLGRYWRDQASQASLGSLFEEACFFANAYQMPSLPDPEPAPVHTTAEFTPEFYADWQNRRDELIEKVDQLLESDEGEPSWDGTEVTGSAEGGRVKVTLDMFGRARTAALDEHWLSGAGTSQVCRAILAAYADGLARHTPPELDPGERGQAAEQLTQLRGELFAAMNNGFQFGQAPRP